MIIISSSLVLGATPETHINAPLIGWHNLVTANNITADTAATDYPASNMANPITAPGARWRANDTTPQAVSVSVQTVDPIDYIAIAKHNLGSEAISVTVEGSTDDGDNWSELVQEVLLADDAPAIFRFTPVPLTDIRLSLGAGDAAAEIAVLYTGLLLALQRRIYVGHEVLPYNRKSKIVNGRSEAGDFLGRIVVAESLASALDLKNVTPSFFRTSMQPWILSAVENPWFFAWRPGDYPSEVGYCFSTSDVTMSNQRRNGMVQVGLQMNGVI